VERGVKRSTLSGTGKVELEAALRAEGLDPFTWAQDGPYFYEPHDHDYVSILVCSRGSITFHVDGTDVELRPGDRLDLPAGVTHAATVPPEGVEVVEAIA
jgi:mannose-6-phosphate isomerase-like protein (cupin superfamily)